MGQAQSQSMGGDCTDCHSSRESKSGWLMSQNLIKIFVTYKGILNIQILIT